MEAASDGLEAVEVFQKEKGDFDLVLLDLTMPGLAGQDVLVRLKETDPDVKVIFCSGFSHGAKAEALLAAGACAFLQKPFSDVELSHALRRALLG